MQAVVILLSLLAIMLVIYLSFGITPKDKKGLLKLVLTLGLASLVVILLALLFSPEKSIYAIYAPAPIFLILLAYHWQKWILAEKPSSTKVLFRDFLVICLSWFIIASFMAFYTRLKSPAPDADAGAEVIIMLFIIITPLFTIPFILIYRFLFYALTKSLNRLHLLITSVINGALLLVYPNWGYKHFPLEESFNYYIFVAFVMIVSTGVYLGLLHLIKALIKKLKH